ncbi:MAG TPA: hypothetical protein VHD95_07135 [Rhizomicrobium sp.]|nr:hypothetical protein [Rhizomicrobium sp.]
MGFYLRCAVIMLAVTATACSKPNSAPATDAPTGPELHLFRTADDAGRLAIVNAEAAVKDRLKDPDSAKFDPLKDVVGYMNGRPVLVCGQVNAKNSFGAYTGDQYWLANLTNNEVLIGADPATANAACSAAGLKIAFGK